MLDERFVLLGVALNVAGATGYLIATLKGRVKPNRVSWFLWGLAPMVAFSAEISQGVGLRALMTFATGFNPLVIFLASFVNKKSEWRISRLDIICGILSIGGLILWGLTRVGNIAIAASILADGLAAVPTIVKAFKYPETENYLAFGGGGISALITLLTIRTWTFAHYAFPIYIFSICLLLVALIKFRLGKRLRLAIPVKR